VVLPAAVFLKGEAKVWVTCDDRQAISMKGVIINDGLSFVVDPHDVALVSIKGHLPRVFPVGELVQILLKLLTMCLG
jgi:hypothetical protein